MQFPLKAGPPAAPAYLTPCFRKDASLTTERLNLRRRELGLSLPPAPSRLDSPSLVSSVHGVINRLLFTLPSDLFDDEERRKRGDFGTDAAATVKNLLGQISREAALLIMTHEVSVARLQNWLAELNLTAQTAIVPVRNEIEFTIWAEDAYVVCDDQTDGEKFFVEPESFPRGDDPLVADQFLARAPVTRMSSINVNLLFQGGNTLIGDEFWLIGMDDALKSLERGFVKPNPGETDLAAVQRVYKANLDHNRSLISVRSNLPVPIHDDRKFEMGGQIWKEFFHQSNQLGTVQPIFHIDMFLTLAGRDRHGRPQILVGDPLLAARVTGQPLPDHAQRMPEIFDDIASQFAKLGFKVIRNPLPLTYDDNEKDRERKWYYATANNALVEITADRKQVWLPTYGHQKWPELAPADQLNKDIWEKELGFTVHQLGNFHPFASLGGAAHCIKKYLARG